MIMRMFAIKDVKMSLFLNPMCFNSRGQCLRMVTDEVNRKPDGQAPETTLQSHPEDMELYEICEFDSESGVVTASKGPVLVAQCKDLLIGRS